MSATKTLIIGIGNPWRRDDGLGPAVIRALASESLPAGVWALEQHGEGLALLDAWQGYARVLIVDAIRANAAVGSLYCFDVVRQDLPTGLFNYSSHQFGLAEAIALGRSLGRLAPIMTVYGVVGADFSCGEGLSAAVEAAKTGLSTRIRSCVLNNDWALCNY